MSAPRDHHNIALHLGINTYTVAYERCSARSTQSRLTGTGMHFCTPNYPRSLQLKNNPRDHYLSTLCYSRSLVMPKYAKIGHTYCRENYTNEMQGPRSTQNRKCTSLLSENARPTQRPNMRSLVRLARRMYIVE